MHVEERALSRKGFAFFAAGASDAWSLTGGTRKEAFAPFGPRASALLFCHSVPIRWVPKLFASGCVTG